MLERSGLKAGLDFFLAFSPERVDPGNKKFNIKNITKVVGGINEKSTGSAALLYGQIVDKVHKVSSPRVAEIEKLLENVFRSVNIALVNELSILCKKMDIDVWEVINAAKTKPYGFMPFYPGPGIGGHCIPLDPFYLAWKAREYGINAKFIELAGEVNDRMPEYVVELIQNSLNKKGKAIKGSNIVVYGVAYKKDISDQRESPALKIIEILMKNEAKLSYNDSYVPKIHLNGTVLHSRDMSAIKNCDCAVIATDHSYYDYKAIVKKASIVIDTRNATSGMIDPSGKIVKL
jgi:UDP-N-acetyl-D-glucosamine dehydrogenase